MVREGTDDRIIEKIKLEKNNSGLLFFKGKNAEEQHLKKNLTGDQ